jgi:hypothetical protein
VEIGGANTPLVLDLTQSGEALTGTMTLGSDTVPIAGGAVTGGEFRFQASLRRGEQEEIYAVSGRAEGEILRGKVTFGDREVAFTAARSPLPRAGGESE